MLLCLPNTQLGCAFAADLSILAQSSTAEKMLEARELDYAMISSAAGVCLLLRQTRKKAMAQQKKEMVYNLRTKGKHTSSRTN